QVAQQMFEKANLPGERSLRASVEKLLWSNVDLLPLIRAGKKTMCKRLQIKLKDFPLASVDYRLMRMIGAGGFCSIVSKIVK
ncbi:MAG: hypothetical protein LLG04_16235, partial [Parachlamydia sp.]|nr:hypothetical protein [Parachlamydia sp.]